MAAQSRKVVATVSVIAIVVIAVVGVLVTSWVQSRPTAVSTSVPTPVPTISVPPTPSEWPTPSPGDTVVPTSEPSPIDAPLDGPAEVSAGVSAEVTSIESFNLTTALPGEIAGPALKLTVRVTNGTSSTLDLSGSSVTLAYGASQTPASDVGDPTQTGLPTSVAPGSAVTGEYSFTVPTGSRDQVRVTVDLLYGAPQVVFSGAVPE